MPISSSVSGSSSSTPWSSTPESPDETSTGCDSSGSCTLTLTSSHDNCSSLAEPSRCESSASSPVESDPSEYVHPKLKAASREPLYAGADISVHLSYLLVFHIVVRHTLSAKAFTELLQLLSVHLPKVPTSAFKLKSFFSELFPDDLRQFMSCSLVSPTQNGAPETCMFYACNRQLQV